MARIPRLSTATATVAPSRSVDSALTTDSSGSLPPTPLGHGRQRSRWQALIVILAVVVFAVVTAVVIDRTTTKTNPAVERTVAQYVELQQSVLIPNVSGSASWPAVVPSHETIRPARDTKGSFNLSPQLQASMVKAATKALASRKTTRCQQGHDWWIQGAIATEASDGFQVIGAGVRITDFHITSLTANTASVTEQSDDWQVQAFASAGGGVSHHTLENEGAGQFSLIRSPDGRWLVDQVTLGFAAGHGP